jgi:hypothetical protein
MPSGNGSIAEDHQRGDGPDVKLSSQVRRCLGVDLLKPDLWLELGCSPLEDWTHGLARAAPGSPEVDDHGNVVALNMLGKTVSQDGRGSINEEWLFAAGRTSPPPLPSSRECD